MRVLITNLPYRRDPFVSDAGLYYPVTERGLYSTRLLAFHLRSKTRRTKSTDSCAKYRPSGSDDEGGKWVQSAAEGGQKVWVRLFSR
jgi:hypothetical protein